MFRCLLLVSPNFVFLIFSFVVCQNPAAVVSYQSLLSVYVLIYLVKSVELSSLPCFLYYSSVKQFWLEYSLIHETDGLDFLPSFLILIYMFYVFCYKFSKIAYTFLLSNSYPSLIFTSFFYCISAYYLFDMTDVCLLVLESFIWPVLKSAPLQFLFLHVCMYGTI
jgi:hypothetical protein